MSETPSDGAISCFQSTLSDCQLPALSELSAKDKPWDKHRANSDRVSSHYSGTQFDRYSQRIDTCSQLLDFKLSPDADEGAYKLKLSSARFCRVRHCPVCQWRRSLMWKAKAYKILPNIIANYPKYRWLFVTLTVKNCPVWELKRAIQSMNDAYKRMTKRKVWPAVGWIKSTEVTRGRDGSAHPHFHCLLMVSSSYFSGRDYMKKSQWIELWRSCLRVDYKPIMDVQAVKKGSQPTNLVPELLKYCTKESDLVKDKEWLIEYTRQMHKNRAIGIGGVLKTYMKEIEEDPDDLIGEGDDPDSVDEGHLFFGWRMAEKKYRLLD